MSCRVLLPAALVCVCVLCVLCVCVCRRQLAARIPDQDTKSGPERIAADGTRSESDAKEETQRASADGVQAPGCGLRVDPEERLSGHSRPRVSCTLHALGPVWEQRSCVLASERVDAHFGACVAVHGCDRVCAYPCQRAAQRRMALLSRVPVSTRHYA